VKADTILGLMSQGNPDQELHWDDIPVVFATVLANISSRVTEEELYTLIALGTRIFEDQSLAQSKDLLEYIAEMYSRNTGTT